MPSRISKQKAKLVSSGLRLDRVVEDVPGFATRHRGAKADLVVMGSRGLTGLKHAARLRRGADDPLGACPVLTVKHGGALQLRKIVAMDSPGAHRALDSLSRSPRAPAPRT
jgi:hypothetical protein